MIVGWVCRGPVPGCTGQTLRCTGQTHRLQLLAMSKKITCLLFVLTVAGCHAQSEGAVCPAPEEEISTPDEEPSGEPEQLPPEQIEKEKRRIRERRRKSTW